MKTFVWDNHQCMPLRPGDTAFLAELRNLKKAGVDVVSLNVGFDLLPWSTSLQLLATFRHWLKLHDEEFYLVEAVEDIRREWGGEKLGVTFDIEGGSALDNHLSMIQLYYDLGVRWMLFAYNEDNSLGGGCRGQGRGLTRFGAQVLQEMERVGMVVCCSHVSHTTAMDIMNLARHPVIFSHSNPYSLKAHYRNIVDEAIVACAKTGGVIGICGVGALLGDSVDLLESYVAAIDYTVQLVGPEHVGIGTDYVYDKEELYQYVSSHKSVFGQASTADIMSMLEPWQLSEVAETLLRRNYSEAHIEAIFGGNYLRVAKSVWH